MTFARPLYLLLAVVLLTPFSSSFAFANKLQPGEMICPSINQLQKDPVKRVWFALNGWLSFSPSFSNKIEKFLGAQWQGVNLGTIACLYQGNEKLSFPIILQFNRLVTLPSGGQWTKDLGGYANCRSNQQIDCIFKPEQKPKAGSLSKQLDELKPKKSLITEPGF